MDHKAELISKLTALVVREFGGDPERCFNYYDSDHDGRLTRDEMLRVLEEAGVGNVFTRKFWIGGVLAAVDADHDGALSFKELESAMQQG